MWSHSSIRVTAGPSALLQIRRGKTGKQEGDWTWTSNIMSLSTSVIYSTGELLGKGKNTKATAEDRGILVWLLINYAGGSRSEVWRTEELLLDCGSEWIFVVLSRERLQSCVPGDAVGVRSHKWVAVQQTLMGFPSLDFTTASHSTPSHCGGMQRLCLIQVIFQNGLYPGLCV